MLRGPIPDVESNFLALPCGNGNLHGAESRRMYQPIFVEWNSLYLSLCLCTEDLIVKAIGVSNMVIKTISNTLMISVLMDGYYKTTEFLTPCFSSSGDKCEKRIPGLCL